jgi:hypothetical protein
LGHQLVDHLLHLRHLLLVQLLQQCGLLRGQGAAGLATRPGGPCWRGCSAAWGWARLLLWLLLLLLLLLALLLLPLLPHHVLQRRPRHLICCRVEDVH